MNEWPLTKSELADRHGVHRATIGRALDAATRAHTDDPEHNPPPPAPANPGAATPRWLPSVFDPWWAKRPRPGRRWPARTDTTEEP